MLEMSLSTRSRRPEPPAATGVRATARAHGRDLTRRPAATMRIMNSPHSPFPLDAAWRIDRERLATLLARPVRDWPVEIVDETGSTNADLMARIKQRPRDPSAGQNGLEPLVRVAYSQTAGRGRRGRPWVAQPGNALLLSIACVVARPIEGLAGLSLAIGTGVLDALSRLPLS